MQQPQLKDHVYYARMAQGVYFRALGQQFVLKGADIYPAVVNVLQLMDGQRSVDDIIAALPAAHQAFSRQLIAQLMRHQMLRDGATLPCSAQQASPLVRYLADRHPEALSKLTQWQSLHIGLSGDSEGLLTATKALVRQGIRRISIHLADSCPASRQQECELLRQDLSSQADISLLQLNSLPIADKTVLLLQHPQPQRQHDLERADYVNTHLGEKGLVLANSETLTWPQLVAGCNYDADHGISPSRVQQQVGAAVLIQQLIDEFFAVPHDRNLLPAIDSSGVVSRHPWRWTGAAVTDLQQLRTYLLDPCFGPMQEIDQDQLPQIPLQMARLALRKAPFTAVTGAGSTIAQAENNAMQLALALLNDMPMQTIGLNPHRVAVEATLRQQLASFPLQAHPVVFDRFTDRDLQQRYTMWHLMQPALQVQAILFPAGGIALRARANPQAAYRYVYGEHKNELLTALLTELLIPLQLNTLADDPSAATDQAQTDFSDLTVTPQALPWSEIPAELLATALLQPQPISNSKLVGTGLFAAHLPAKEMANVA